jgi:hypothetical protein
MSEDNRLFLDQIKDSARKLVHAGQDVRNQLHELTVKALTRGRLAEQEIREVLEAVTEGVSLGATQRAEELRAAMGDALGGIDDALANAAEAMRQALSEAGSHTRDFAEGDLKQGLDELKRLEQMFLETLSYVAEGASGLVRQEFTALTGQARQTGTGTGERVKAVTRELAGRLRATAHEAGDAAIQISARAAMVASGKLADIATRIQRKADALKQDK